jgi:hypothetical protein
MSKWRPERRGPGRAERMFVEIGGARFELLAYTYDTGENRLASGFEIFARDSRGRYVDQVAMGEAASLDESKALAEAAVRRPRSQWPVLTLA